MHEYRLADADRRAKKGSLRVSFYTHKKKERAEQGIFLAYNSILDRSVCVQLDDWVLCRLYNKKNEWEKMRLGKGQSSAQPKRRRPWT
jgi:hypothetical protein